MRYLLILLSLLLIATCASAAEKELCLDTFDGKTLGSATGITFAPGKDGQAVVFDAPTDSITYPAEDFFYLGGGIEFDLMLTKPLSPDHGSWNIFSDVGAGYAFVGAVNVYWHEKTKDLLYGIYDGGGYRWCRSKIEWQPNKWYHIKLTYGPQGMEMLIDSQLQESNDYKGGLCKGPKKLGYYDGLVVSPPVMVDNFRTFCSDIDYIDIQSRLLSPNKDGLYETSEIKYGVQSNSTATMDVTDKSGKVVATVFENKQLAPGRYSVTWNGSSLKDGDYTVSLKVKNGDQPVTNTDTVRIDTRWKWKKPQWSQGDFFPLGAWFHWEDISAKQIPWEDRKTAKAYYEKTIKTLADNGFNTMILCWIPKVHRDIVLDTAQKYGIKVIVNTDELCAAMQNLDPKTQPDMYDSIISDIKAVKDHPAVIGWYICDEPPPNQPYIERVALTKTILEAVDPKHPSYICFIGGYENAFTTVDTNILLIDIYTLGEKWNGSWAPYISEMNRGQRNAGDKPIWVIPQNYGMQGGFKIPTPEEVSAQTWLSLAHNAKGFVQFIYQSTYLPGGQQLRGLLNQDLKPMDERLAALAKLHKDLQKLAPTILKIHPADFTLPVQSDQVHATAFADKTGVKYAIVVNLDVKNSTLAVWNGGEAEDVLTGAKIGKTVVLPAGGGKIIQM